ncbi:uncharacterized protein YpuA (DUF1002 family) [Caldanaerobacter subterraneus subsp. tengcongensis MB4]|nr:DUF1002 domain-containing protein [Caldanaerobacter subterraneus]KKC29877.1 hypothetical protein CDSM653_01106 [Caldanaerobacter subterraneus subsp. pacificus DSM 12653]MCS3916101.1 uncharacterized protein YpuA (DUF1002 family) [Caldanaerobacter subterraneus subsp. tengcongensis MB4]
MRKVVSLFLIILFSTLALINPIYATEREIVTLGSDLTPSQQQEMLKYFGVEGKQVKIIKVTNEEERKYLEGLVPGREIGTRAISSAYLQLLPEGEGILVDTHNITWVSKEMYANAMITAGIKDARVVVAAPFKVSGTAALTGIMKAFEEATGKKLSEEAKKTANEELVITGKLAEKVGEEKAAELLEKVKKEVIEKRLTDENEIANVIKEVASKLNINLTEDQISQIVQLMKKINQLNLDIETVKKQLEKIGADVEKIKKTVEENKGILQKILKAIQGFLDWLFSLFR